MEDFKVPTLPPPPTLVPQPAVAEVESEEEAKSGNPIIELEPQPVPQQSATANGAQKLKATNPVTGCTYKVPPWSAPPTSNANYKFEVLKSGQIIEEVKELQKQAKWVFGRLPENDITMAHPTISRYHAVLQYRPKALQLNDEADGEDDPVLQPAEGWYIYDLDSTHGTFLNKQRIPARIFIRMRVGHILRLGASTRSYILQGPEEDEEPESELSVTELRQQHQQKLIDIAAEAKRKAAEAVERERKEGCGWGMAEDADEETDLTHNPYASTNNEELFLDDPKRTLRGYFEREGIPLEYKCDEMSAGSFVCRVELPLDDANGRPIIAEVVHKGRKKECVVQCALEACRILDRHGVLRQANQEPQKRKLKSQGSDSDNDDFLDRTGDIERKKMRKANANTTVTLTYEDLLKQETELEQQLQQVDNDIEKYHIALKRLKETKAHEAQNVDDLDSFMLNLSDDSTQLDKTEIRKLRLEQQRLKAEQQKLQRLIKIAKPLELPFAKAIDNTTSQTQRCGASEDIKKQLPMIGKRNRFTKFQVIKLNIAQATETKAKTTQPAGKITLSLKSDEEETEDEEQVLKADKDVRKEKKSEAIETDILHEAQEQAAKDKDDLSDASTEVKRYGPAVIPQEILKNKSSNDAQAVEENPSTHVETAENCDRNHLDEAAILKEQQESAAKKRRQRQRLRHKRQEVDIDELEEHESSEKYAKWVPPENQSGDGYTPLNEKYGY